MFSRIKNIYEYRDMIYSLVRRELRGRYKGSVLGFCGHMSILYARLSYTRRYSL